MDLYVTKEGNKFTVFQVFCGEVLAGSAAYFSIDTMGGIRVVNTINHSRYRLDTTYAMLCSDTYSPATLHRIVTLYDKQARV